MMTFDALEFMSHPNCPGVQAVMAFDNGYSVSVIQSPYSYGGDEGLYELAVKYADELVYDTPVTDDVLGHLTPADVTAAMQAVAALPARVAA